MVHRVQIIDEIVEDAAQAESKKMQLSANVKLEKEASEDEGTFAPTVHLNFKMEKKSTWVKYSQRKFFSRFCTDFFCVCSVLLPPLKWVDAQRDQ